jgi:hypothetical protein
MSVKSLTRSFTRKLKNSDLSLGGELSLKLTKKKAKTSFKESEAIKPSFDMKRSENIMVVTGTATDTRVLVESFL